MITNASDLFSIRQVADQTGKSYRTICNYIDKRKIECVMIDTFRAIPGSEVDKINLGMVSHDPRFRLEGYKTIPQVSKILGIPQQNLKRYVRQERIANVKKWNVYFIPDDVTALWKQIDKPDPNKIEAHENDCLTVQDTARKMGCSDSKVRALLSEGLLEPFMGYCRRYVTVASIDIYIGYKKKGITEDDYLMNLI